MDTPMRLLLPRDYEEMCFLELLPAAGRGVFPGCPCTETHIQGVWAALSATTTSVWRLS